MYNFKKMGTVVLCFSFSFLNLIMNLGNILNWDAIYITFLTIKKIIFLIFP